MKKWVISFIVALSFLLVFPIEANAAQQRALRPSVTLYYEDNTAYCSAIVTDPGKKLNITLELWHEETLVNSWTAKGEGKAFVEGNCKVVKGQTYTLIVTGTTNGTPFSSTPFSRTY